MEVIEGARFNFAKDQYVAHYFRGQDYMDPSVLVIILNHGTTIEVPMSFEEYEKVSLSINLKL